MQRVRIELARQADDAELRSVMHNISMPGVVRLAALREPGFFDALQVEGCYSEVVIGRVRETGRIIGLGTRSIKSAFINGRPSPLGYLSNLRLSGEYRGGMILAQGYRFIRRRHGDARTTLYVTTIIEENTAAREIITSGRCGLPIYHDYGRFCSMAISLRQKPRTFPSKSLEIRPATREDSPSIIEFLWREGGKRQFFPVYSADDLLSSSGLLRGLEPHDILLAYEGKELVGTVAAWNQNSFRQSRVMGYSKRLAFLRIPYNGIARLMGFPILPRPGSNLDYFNLALTCIRNDDPRVFAALLRRMITRHRSHYKFFMAGLHERDPLLPVLRRYRHFPYTSRLYVVCWEDGEADFAGLDGQRVPYLELGAL